MNSPMADANAAIIAELKKFMGGDLKSMLL